jgi:hypothetical protein
MLRKIAILAIACLTVAVVTVANNIIPTILAQPATTDAFEKLAQASVTNATGSEKTFVALLSCNTAQPDFNQTLEDQCDFTVLVPAP